MKVGDLVRCKFTGKISVVMWCYNEHGTHFTVAGYSPNQVFNSSSWELLNESR